MSSWVVPVGRTGEHPVANEDNTGREKAWADILKFPMHSNVLLGAIKAGIIEQPEARDLDVVDVNVPMGAGNHPTAAGVENIWTNSIVNQEGVTCVRLNAVAGQTHGLFLPACLLVLAACVTNRSLTVVLPPEEMAVVASSFTLRRLLRTCLEGCSGEITPSTLVDVLRRLAGQAAQQFPPVLQ